MTNEEVKAVREQMEMMAGELAQHAEDVLIMVVVRHQDDRPEPTRQMLHSGRGNFWARLGMAGMFFVNQSITADEET